MKDYEDEDGPLFTEEEELERESLAKVVLSGGEHDHCEFMRRRREKLCDEMVKKLLLDTGPRGAVHQHFDNTVEVIDYLFENKLYKDTFSGQLIFYDEAKEPLDSEDFEIESGFDFKKLKRLNEANRLRIMAKVHGRSPLKAVSERMIYNAIDDVCNRHEINIRKLWLESLTRDVGEVKGNEHSELFPRYCGADDTPLNRDAGENFCRAIVHCALESERKLDEIYILEGKQGTFKSTFWEVFGGPDGRYFAETGDKLSTKEFIEALDGMAIVELNELASIIRDHPVYSKVVISRKKDTLRKKYRRDSGSYNRLCILVGTTNEDYYLVDVTGNRRFICIETNGDIKIEELKANLGIMLKCALLDYKAGKGFHEFDKKELEFNASRRLLPDANKWFINSAIETFRGAPQQSGLKYDVLNGIVEFTMATLIKYAEDNALRIIGKNPEVSLGRALRRRKDITPRKSRGIMHYSFFVDAKRKGRPYS